MCWEICAFVRARSKANEKFRQSARQASAYIVYALRFTHSTVRRLCWFTGSVSTSQSHCQRVCSSAHRRDGISWILYFQRSERLNKHTKWLIKSNCHMRIVRTCAVAGLYMQREISMNGIEAKIIAMKWTFLARVTYI